MKTMGHPLRIRIFIILVQEQLASVTTIQQNLPGIDPFLLYTNLRYMLKKQLVNKLRKGREVYYRVSDEATNAGLVGFFQDQYSKGSIHFVDEYERNNCIDNDAAT